MSRNVKKVLLAVPPTGLYIREDRCQTPIENLKTVALRPPIDLLYAGAAFERGGATCRLVDYPGERRGETDLENDLREFAPDMVVLSITTPGFDDDMRVATRIKRVAPDAVVAAKGAHFNTLDRAALERCADLDLALRGEFEPACRELAEGRPWEQIAGLTFRSAPNGEIVRTADRPFIEDLDSLPFPARHLANNSLYFRPDTGALQTTVVTNRGCPYDCIFCLSNQVAGRRNRVRSVGNILAEIEECVGRFGIRSFLFRSDLFTADRAWVLDLCREIRTRRLPIEWSCNSRVDSIDLPLLEEMKRAGCWIVAFGIESGDQAMLDRMGKKTDLDAAREALAVTRRAGILSSVYFLIGLPWETRETLAANERFAREIDPDVLEIFYVYPFPGTSLYRQAVSLGLLEDGEIPRQAYDGPAMPSLALSREELARARTRAMRQFYTRPRFVLRTLRRARSAREFANYVRCGWRQLKDFL
ncbi:radical SAM protein [Candidatus Sumerlaeota bacterium]|nr:radical SAM protein [Candidatus Sumerlaeota bacterium]